MAQSETAELRQTSYWLDGLPPLPPLTSTLPDQVDVAIVGSGYTGLNAAIETARAGMNTLVLEAGTPGMGCSSRNGGQIGHGIKPSLAELTRRYGAEWGRAIRMEGMNAMAFIGERIEREGIDCDYKRCGLYLAAHTPGHYDELARMIDLRGESEGAEGHLVPRSEQRSELGSDAYYGGAVFADNAGLHPAKYVRGLMDVALKAGAEIIGDCHVVDIARQGEGFLLNTRQGQVKSRQVIVATNGYTTNISGWLKRRFMPINSNIIATQPLPRDLMDALFPTDRMICDTRKIIYYYRASPDRTRVLFGGRVAPNDIGAEASAARLRQEMCRLFPELSDYGLTHSWFGTVAYTFDELPHISEHEGIHYSMGYCGSGVALSSYLGAKLGRRVAGAANADTAFDGLPHPTRPLYTGKPWFLPAAIAYFKWRDTRELVAAERADTGR